MFSIGTHRWRCLGFTFIRWNPFDSIDGTSQIHRMRWELLVLVVGACSCGVAAEEGPEPQPLDTFHVESVAPEPTQRVAPQTVPGVLCWTIEPAVEARYPSIREALDEAHGRWGWAADFDREGCLNRVRLVAMEPNEDGTVPAGAQLTRAHTADGQPRSAAQNGVSDLWINSAADLWEGSFDSCRASWSETGVGRTMLMRTLTHELGHVLGLEHVDVKSVMFGISGACWDPLPSESELASCAR